MRYLITAMFGAVAFCFGLAVAWTIMMGITDSWQWFLVSVGILIPNVVLVLITCAAYAAAREY